MIYGTIGEVFKLTTIVALNNTNPFCQNLPDLGLHLVKNKTKIIISSFLKLLFP